MLFAQPALVCLLLVIMSAQPVILQAVNMCRRIAAGQQRTRVLTGHVISTQEANGFDVCAALCVENSSCYSVNYYDSKNKCELNDKTSFNNPEHMIVELDGSYLDIHRPYNDCSDLFCNLEDICKMSTVDRTRCTACNSAFGMENGKINDSQITASSVLTANLLAAYGRLNKPGPKCWGAERMRSGEWLKIDFGQKMVVTKVATQGRAEHEQWVTSYKLSFSEDAGMWEVFKENGQEKIFAGNTDRNTAVSHVLWPKIRHARYVRFVVMTWEAWICMRVEVYGCEE